MVPILRLVGVGREGGEACVFCIKFVKVIDFCRAFYHNAILGCSRIVVVLYMLFAHYWINTTFFVVFFVCCSV